MPTKHLGDRLYRDDVLRPASLTLTAEDLRRLPDFEMSTDSEGNNRLSKRFGGTLRLKTRLSSLPQIKLNKRLRGSREYQPSQNIGKLRKAEDEDQGFAVMTIDREPLMLQQMPKAEPATVKDLEIPRHPETISHALSGSQRTVTEPLLHSQTPDIIHTNAKRDHIPRPVHSSCSLSRSFTSSTTNQSKTRSEVLFDEIITSYQEREARSAALTDEIDRIMNHISKQYNIPNSKKIWNDSDIESVEYMPPTPPREPKNRNSLFSNADYMDQTDSVDDLSVNSAGNTSYNDIDTDHEPCFDDEYDDLDHSDTCPKSSQGHSNLSEDTILKPNVKYELLKLRSVHIEPNIVTWDSFAVSTMKNPKSNIVRPEDPLGELNKKIDQLSILSASSSVYSAD